MPFPSGESRSLWPDSSKPKSFSGHKNDAAKANRTARCLVAFGVLRFPVAAERAVVGYGPVDFLPVGVLDAAAQCRRGVRDSLPLVSRREPVVYFDFERDSWPFRTKMTCTDRLFCGKRTITAALRRLVNC